MCSVLETKGIEIQLEEGDGFLDIMKRCTELKEFAAE